MTVVTSAFFLCILGVRMYGSLYPIAPFIIGITLVIIIVLQFSHHLNPLSTFGGIVALSILYRLILYLHPASYIGADSDGFAFWIERMIFVGDISAINSKFYSSAPNYLIFGGMVDLISGLPLKHSLAVIPLLVGFLTPTVSYIVARQFGLAPSYAALAASFTVMIPSTVSLSINPVPQSLAVLIALTIIILVVQGPIRPQVESVGLAVLLYFALLFTHKLSPFLFALGFLLGGAVETVRVNQREQFRDRRIISSGLGFGLVFMTMYILQWEITDIERSIAATLHELIIGGAEETSIAITPTFAEPLIDSTIVLVFLNSGYFIPMLFFGGLGWLLMAYRQPHYYEKTIFLTLIGLYISLTIFAHMGLVAETPIRFFFLVTPLVGVLVATTIEKLICLVRSNSKLKPGIILLVVLLIIGPQIVSITGPPDGGFNERRYLHESEMVPKFWIDQHVDGVVAVDDWYATEMPPSLVESYAKQFDTPPQNYQPASDRLLNASMHNGTQCLFAIRQGVRVYSLQGKWKLTYTPKSLAHSEQLIYTSGNPGTGIALRRSC